MRGSASTTLFLSGLRKAARGERVTEGNARYADELFPSDYSSWRYCIEVKCGLALTNEFLAARIRVLSDPLQEETRRFTKLYGERYHAQVLSWMQQAAAEVS